MERAEPGENRGRKGILDRRYRGLSLRRNAFMSEHVVAGKSLSH